MALQQRFVVGPGQNGYIYNLVPGSSPPFWRCDRPAMGWGAPPGWTLYIVKVGAMWLAMHAPRESQTAAAVIEKNAKVFGSAVPDVTTDGWHEWDSWDPDTDQWSGRADWAFETRRL